MAKYIVTQDMGGEPIWYLSDPCVYWEADQNMAYQFDKTEILEVLQKLTTMQRVSSDSLVFTVTCIK